MTAKIRFSVCMALASVLLNTWPVPINGRTVRERDDTNSRGRATERLCHDRLKAAMKQVCPHGFYTPESVNNIAINRNRNRRGFSDSDNAIIQRRVSRSIVSECCLQSCSPTTLSKYCTQDLAEDLTVQATQQPSMAVMTTRSPKLAQRFGGFYGRLREYQPYAERVWQPASPLPRQQTRRMARPFRHRLQARDTSDVSSSFMRFRTFQQRPSSAETDRNRTNGGQRGNMSNGRLSIQRRTLPETRDNDLTSGIQMDQTRDNYPSSIQIVTEEALPEPVALGLGLNDQFYFD